MPGGCTTEQPPGKQAGNFPSQCYHRTRQPHALGICVPHTGPHDSSYVTAQSSVVRNGPEVETSVSRRAVGYVLATKGNELVQATRASLGNIM